ncbi:MAG: hypothetical protein VW268_13810 [Rhodospirillaceae bacterium]
MALRRLILALKQMRDVGKRVFDGERHGLGVQVQNGDGIDFGKHP